MLTLSDHPQESKLPQLSRREFLAAGTLGLGSLSLSSLISAAEINPRLVTGKSVIFLFQQGGPSQFETFDPKPLATDAVRTLGGIRDTTLPGIQFGLNMERLASLTHKLTVVRSFQTNNASHNIEPIVSPDTLQANIGALYSSVVGSVDPDTGMPSNTVLFPQAVCDDVTKGKARGDISATGTFGSTSAPFIPGSGGQLQKNMRLNLEANRFEDRRALWSSFNQAQKKLDASASAQHAQQVHEQAFQLLLSNRVAEAFDLTNEDPKVVEKYDTSRFMHPNGWSKSGRGKRGYYSGQAKSLGKLLLLARRLCEAGCGFVTIHADYDGVWDMHGDGNNLGIVEGMEAVGRPFDHAVSTFIEDVEARGMQDEILLVCCGEMGRTPKVNKRGGRDHWSRLAPLLMYGGGLSGGQVIGQSTSDGGEPASEPVNCKHLISTILHTVFDVGQLRLVPEMARVARLGEHPTIPGLV